MAPGSDGARQQPGRRVKRAVLRRNPRPPRQGRSAAERELLTGVHSRLAYDRLLFFSDAVFAIAITFLALELRLPAHPAAGHPAGSAAVWAALGSIWTRYLSFAVSFVVIGMYWLGHHRMFRLINRFNDRLVWLNLLFLLFVVVIPFPTTVLGDYENTQAAVVLYAGNLALTGIMQTVIWRYSTARRRLVQTELTEERYRYLVGLVTVRMLIPPLVFLLSIGVSFFSVRWASFSWILIAPALLLTRLGARRRGPGGPRAARR
jgi:uncharacterized membrane protein